MVITIIILLILAGISINILNGENGIINRAKEAKIQTEIAEIKEQIQTDILREQLENQGNMLENSLKIILESYGTIIYEEDGKMIKGVKTKKNYEILLSEVYNGTIQKSNGILATEAITKDNYGDSVDYEANGVTDWKIFLNDETNIFIISGDIVPREKLSFVTGVYYGNYENTVSYSNNVDLLNWMNDELNWSSFAEGIKEAKAKGGPTLNQFVESYNQKNGTNYSGDAKQEDNFIEGLTGELYKCSCNYYLNEKSLKYLNSVWFCYGVSYSDGLWNTTSPGDKGIRPLVCLPSNIYAKKENNKWTFYK